MTETTGFEEAGEKMRRGFRIWPRWWRRWTVEGDHPGGGAR
jgi:hypothetical protein